jgi:hypothetical protein
MKVYEKYAWILLFAIGVIFLVTGLPHALGINTDPETVQRISGVTIDQLKDSNPAFFNLYNFYFSFGGLDDIGFGFFVTVISLTAYRKGEKVVLVCPLVPSSVFYRFLSDYHEH